MLAKLEINTATDWTEQINRKIKDHPVKTDGLYSGESGLLLFYLYTYLTDTKQHWKDILFEKLDGVLERLGEPSGLSTLISVCAGLTGLGWVLNSLRKYELIGSEYDDFILNLNSTIAKRAVSEARGQNLDYMHGSIGALTYLCEGDMTSEIAREHVSALTREILARQSDEHGFIKNEYIFRKLGYTTEDDMNLGLAHGLSGILLGILRVYEIGILQDEIRPVAVAGINYILSLANFDHDNDLTKSIFPTNRMLSLAADDPKNQLYYTLRSGWCYGDLNQVLLLYRAGSLLGNNSWSATARQVGLRCVKRTTNAQTWVDNPFLCHGSAVVSLMFDNLMQYDEDAARAFAEGSTFWKAQTLDYMSRFLQDGDRKDVSFLSGFCGVALAETALGNPEFNELQKIMLLY
ncbi:hypothetical protein DSL64_03565 [Dyadobacter luteus]|uniref:Lanthionine synthetase n=1 Tax=Dyadobacter luteus TaxID=2259619 RepID=A0A3D8YG52_9BACT|nr:lanthionine synthetase LanC family protein [Dyadobacter luteus]REA63534.1 hypothetical protein DSL64_03565 [Dyadobacter luteus]